ncbi:hypothetical protein ACF0H5_022514 [Mactra antiquata]
MGNNIFRRLFCKEEVPIVIMGLDAAGKTTALYRLKLGEVGLTISTIGFNVETLKFRNISLIAWDVGGREKLRPLVRHYYQNAKGLVYVLDSADRDRFERALDELRRYVLHEEQLIGVPLLILANKQDLAEAIPPREIASKIMNLDHVGKRPWTVFGVSAVDKHNPGLFEAFDWLVTSIEAKERKEIVTEWVQARYPTPAYDETEKKANRDKQGKENEISFVHSFVESIKKLITNV